MKISTQFQIITIGTGIESCRHTSPNHIYKLKSTIHYINHEHDPNHVCIVYQGHAIHTAYAGYSNKLNNITLTNHYATAKS